MKANYFLPLLLSFILLFSSYGEIETEKANLNGRILYVGGSGPNNYTSIQDAIDDALLGDTIFVYSGVYYENVRIYKSINLIGENEETTIIDGRNGTAMEIVGSEINVSKFKIINSTGSFWEGGGIIITNGQNIFISRIIMEKSDGCCVFDSFRVVFEDCNFSNNIFGFWIRDSHHINITNTILSNNLGKKVNNNTYIGGDGIFILNSSHVRVENCLLYNNRLSGIDGRGASHIYVLNSTIDFGGIEIYHFGILFINTFNTFIENCFVSNSYYAIHLTETNNVSIYRCSVINNYIGFKLTRSRAVVQYNNIRDNEIGMHAFLSIVNARYNYWGSPLGPSRLFKLRGDKLVASFSKVFYFPWLTEEYE